MPKIYLNDTFVNQSHCPSGKGQELFWDHPRGLDGKVRNGAVKGLGLRVTGHGDKAFVHTFDWGGHRKRIKIGKPPHMNVGSARLLVAQRERHLLNGDNPDLFTRETNAPVFTVTNAVEQYWDARAATWSRPYRQFAARLLYPRLGERPASATRRGHNSRQSYRDFQAMFGDQCLSRISPSDMERYLKQFEAPGTYNRAYAHTKAMFTWAIRMQLVDMRNPCDPLSLRKSIRQRRDYSPQQIKAITKHIFAPEFPQLPAVIGTGEEKRLTALAFGRELVSQQQMQELYHFMGILFLTMARPKDLTEAEFGHFDLKRLIWNKHNTKGIKLSRKLYEYAYRSIPIHQRVAEIVEAQRQLYPGTTLVFPSPKDPTQPRNNFKRQLMKFKQLDGVPAHFQLYDLKRIAISLMLVGQGVRREDVSHYVDHRGNLETTMIYDLGFVDPMRPVSDRLGELLGV